MIESSLRILAVDDNSNTLEILDRNLKGRGYEVIKASRVEDALEILNSAVIDLVITDNKMPQVTGMEFLKYLRNHFSHLPVIMITSIYGTKVVGLYGLAHGMVNMPMGLIGKSVSQVYYAEIAKYGKDDTDRIYKLSISIIKKMTLIALVPTSVLIIGGPWLFSTFFGQNWFKGLSYPKQGSKTFAIGQYTTKQFSC